MATRAAWLVDHVIPKVPIRQWVLTLPWARRLVLARRHDLLLGVLKESLDVIFTFYRHRAADQLGLPRKQSRHFRTGSVTQIQRFSSALTLNPHFHSMIPDGVWRRTANGTLEFIAVKPPTTEEVEQIVVLTAERCERWLERQGFGEHDCHDDPDPDDAQLVLQAASAAGMAALGKRAGRRARRIQVHRGRVYQLPRRCAVCDGYNLHAGVRIAPLDREGLERLCRYLARPPVGRERLEEQPDGSILLRLKTAWSDGTAAILLSRSELLQRLLAIVPPPRKNEVVFHGVFAPRSAWRSEIVPSPPADTTPEHLSIRLSREDARSTDNRHYPWAALIWRVFHEDSVSCPHCQRPMRVRTVVLPPATLRVIPSLDRSAARDPPALDSEPPDQDLALAT